MVDRCIYPPGARKTLPWHSIMFKRKEILISVDNTVTSFEINIKYYNISENRTSIVGGRIDLGAAFMVGATSFFWSAQPTWL
jgi:hypothetical protein